MTQNIMENGAVLYPPKLRGVHPSVLCHTSNRILWLLKSIDKQPEHSAQMLIIS